MCSSFSALPVSSQRKVVVPYSLVSHPHCPFLDSPSTSHTCPLCYPLPHSLICVVPSGSTCQGTIQHSIPNKVCVKYYLLLQQFLLFVLPPTPSRSLPLPHTSFSPAQPLAFSFFHYVLHNVGVFSHNITHFDHLILKYLSSPYTSHVSLILLTPRASEIILINGEGVNGVFKEHSIYASAASGIHGC